MQRLIFFFIFSILFFSILKANETRYFVMLKNSKVNVRYGPGFEYPIKYIYKKKYLPIKVIDKSEISARTGQHHCTVTAPSLQ